MAYKKQKITHKKQFQFKAPETKFRYVMFGVEGTPQLPFWHPTAGGSSWVFVDEIVVKNGSDFSGF